jgi:hypothetical protein
MGEKKALFIGCKQVYAPADSFWDVHAERSTAAKMIRPPPISQAVGHSCKSIVAKRIP